MELKRYQQKAHCHYQPPTCPPVIVKEFYSVPKSLPAIAGKYVISLQSSLVKCWFFYTFNQWFLTMNEFFFNEIRNGNFDEVRAMLKKNPLLLDSKDQRGSTPLILSTYYDQEEITDLLLEWGAKIDAKDASGNTALMGVCFKGFTDTAKKLIDKGVSVNERNTMGATCLIYAAMFNREEIAKMLLAKGADVSAKDIRGLTALDHAKALGATSLIALLENAQ
jgi:ankyrin repeat protein